MDISDPVALECADGQADAQHHEESGPDAPAGCHQLRAYRTGETDNRANGKVDVTAGQDTQQHTGSQDKHISVLGQQVIDILRQQDLTARLPGEEDYHQHQNQDHCVLLEPI